jgi:hypothetical protein
MKSKIFGFVHDEIAVDTHPNEAFQVFSIMRKELGETPQRLYKWLSIPVAHSFECGVSWGDKVDIEPTFTEPYSFTAKGSPQRIDALTECMSKWDKPMVIESKVEEAGDEGKTIYKVVYRSTT